MKEITARQLLKNHLRKHQLDFRELIMPMLHEPESSIYLYDEYRLISPIRITHYWQFILADQNYSPERGHQLVGGPTRWCVDISSGLCFTNNTVDALELFENYIIKYEIHRKKIFFDKLDYLEISFDFKKAIDSFYQSNIMDEYALLSFLKSSILLKDYSYSKVDLLQKYHLIKPILQEENKVLIESYLNQYPFNGEREKREWEIVNRILNLSPKEKNELYEKSLKIIDESNKGMFKK